MVQVSCFSQKRHDWAKFLHNIALLLAVQEKKLFEVFFYIIQCKIMICTNLIEDLQMMLYTKYESSGPCSLKQESFGNCRRMDGRTYTLTDWLTDWRTSRLLYATLLRQNKKKKFSKPSTDGSLKIELKTVKIKYLSKTTFWCGLSIGCL